MNVYRDSVIPFTQFGGVTMSPEFTNFNTSVDWVALYAGSGGFEDITSLPDGNYAPVAWRLPLKGGAMTSRTKIIGVGSLTALGNLGYQIVASISGDGTISSALGTLTINLIAEITGTGGVTSASVDAFLFAVANLVGSGDITDAELRGLGELIAALQGEGLLDATFIGTGNLSADITSYGALTPEGLRDAVWNAAAASFNTSGTMGQKLNSAASAGDPWGTDLPSIYTGTQAGAILAEIQVLIEELHKLQGLNAAYPMTVSETERTVDDITITLTETPTEIVAQRV